MMSNPSSGGVGVRLTQAALKTIFPRAPSLVLKAFDEKQAVLSAVGVNQTRRRLAYFFANIHHETGGFTIRNLTENINYTAPRMADVWPNRFRSSAVVRAKYGTADGWQRKAFDDIYGNRMGNRAGTSDGSNFIGRGGPQITGRDGYEQISKRIGVDLVNFPERASDLWLQPEICAAFWDWKEMNLYADAGDFIGCVKAWNGGTNGLADREQELARISPIVNDLEWGEINEPADLIVSSKAPPPKPPPPSTATPQPQPSKWAAFFMAIAKLFKRA
jgi:putative chitinase